MFAHVSIAVHVPCVKVDKYGHFIYEANATYRTICNMIVCRRKHFLDRRSVRNKQVVDSNIHRCSFRHSLQKTADNQC